MNKEEQIDNMIEHLKGFSSFREIAEYVLSVYDNNKTESPLKDTQDEQ